MKLNCHCKNVRISVEKPTEITECNCSICNRYMALWGYYNPSDPKIEIGEGGVSSYSWGDEELNFIRCSTCGCVTHYETKQGQPKPTVAINFGMARNQVSDVPVRHFDGATVL